MNCQHSYKDVRLRRQQHGSNVYAAWCTCDTELQVFTGPTYEKLYEAFMLDLYRFQTGNPDIVWVDMFGTPIEIGSRVVYPASSGGSAYMVEAMVTKINPPGKGYYATGPSFHSRQFDRPWKMQVQPTGRDARTWSSQSKKPRVNTITNAAPSAVVLP